MVLYLWGIPLSKPPRRKDNSNLPKQDDVFSSAYYTILWATQL